MNKDDTQLALLGQDERCETAHESHQSGSTTSASHEQSSTRTAPAGLTITLRIKPDRRSLVSRAGPAREQRRRDD
jgi:hypothetical protein